MDDDARLLGPSREGEVVTRGPVVFEGYLDDPETTDSVLVDGWFHSGDLGRLDEDGYLTLTGRIKETINRGGEKVNPSQVDLALMDHAEVLEAATFPIPHRTLGEEVAAAVVKEPGSKLSPPVRPSAFWLSTLL